MKPSFKLYTRKGQQYCKVCSLDLPLLHCRFLKILCLGLTRGKCSFVPPTLIEQADVMVRKELLSLLEHDNLKYPTDRKVQKENEATKQTVKGNSASAPSIDQFEEDDLKEAQQMIECMAMGHESEPFDMFVEAHRTLLNDVMYFPTHSTYGLSSVAGKHGEGYCIAGSISKCEEEDG